jgi:PAS domain S-box-containing protein
VPGWIAAVAAGTCALAGAARLALHGLQPGWGVPWTDTRVGVSLSALLGAGSIAAHLRGRRWLGAALGALIAIVGVLSLVDVATRGAIGLVELGGLEMRVRPSAAAGMVLAGGALAALGVGRRGRGWAVHVAVVFGAALVGLVTAAALGYDPWRWFDGDLATLRMVPLTGVKLGGLGVGALALAVAHRAGAGSWIPLAIAVGFVTIALTLWSALLLDEKDHLRASTLRAADVLRAAALRERDLRVQAIARHASRWDPSSEVDRVRWRADSDFLVEHLDLRWMVLLRPDGTRVAQTSEGRAPAGEVAPELDLVRKAAEEAPHAVLAHPRGGDLLISVASKHGDVVRAVAQAAVSPVTLMRVATETPLIPTFAFSLEDGGNPMVRGGGWDESAARAVEVVDELRLGDRSLRLRVAPSGELQDFYKSIVPGAVLGAMVLLVLLAALFARRAGRRAESEARAHEDLLRAQRAARIGSWDLDVERNVLRWSDELVRLHDLAPGAAPDTLEGFVRRVVPEDRDRVRAAISEAFAERAPFAFDYRVRRPDGTERTIEARGEVELDARGRVAHLVGTGRDVTERRVMEDRLRAQSEELVEQNRRVMAADRKKSEFLANMSHELRTPLNSVIGFSELLFDGRVGPMTAEQKDLLADVLTSARHLLDLVGDVLDIARLETGHLTLRRETVDLGDLVEETVGSVRVDAARRGLRLRAQVAPDAGTVVTDPSRLRQVLVNFLSNALKFTPEGGSVTVRAAGAGDGLYRVEVADTGIGIRAEDLPRLFEEFEPLDASASKRYPGTGLGLALSRRIVVAMGGTIGVDSAPGKGSTFRAVLPRVMPQPSARDESSAA